MAWVIWHEGDDGRRVYVRRITRNFTSYTVDFADARRWPTRADARRALAGTGLTTYAVKKVSGDDDEPAAP